ncbi:MAG: hypothetical protein ACRC6K_04815 [Fusobacteriaceae bacterium]
MFNKKLILFLIILLTGCSNLTIKEVSILEQQKLTIQLDNFKNSLKTNSINNFDSFFYNNIKAQHILKELKKIDFSEVSFFYSKPLFNNNIATNTIGINSFDRVFYFNLTYQFKNDIWLIINIKEIRR